MNINYQIMEENQKNSKGMYIPDWEKLKAGATCEEELDYINSIISRWDEWKNKGCESYIGFSFNMVYITRQTCGHFEIFQTPCNSYYTLEENLEQAEKNAVERKCSRCITGRR